ncbi:hypothetical protein [uncultured Muribaculum sp.]|uniref:hypothetical protein n=1 Tax=uncultured Muribaculum sp. TaxID=1918613 RepID=UPI002595F5B7|nr:hypothetical protein [uncultured Muribaculum sp.]
MMNLSDSIVFYRIFPVVSLRSATGYRQINPSGFSFRRNQFAKCHPTANLIS